MALKFNTTLRDARLTQIVNALDANTAAGYINFYTGPQPSVAGDAITNQILLGTCTLSLPSGTVSNGILTFNTIADDSAADATGTIAWARLFDGAGTWVADADCGLLGSGATFEFNTLDVITGGVIQVLSGTITEGNA